MQFQAYVCIHFTEFSTAHILSNNNKYKSSGDGDTIGIIFLRWGALLESQKMSRSELLVARIDDMRIGQVPWDRWHY